MPLAQRFGAALVVGLHRRGPEQGMAVTRERKLEVARRSYELLVDKYGVRARGHHLRPAASSRARTGDAAYLGSAARDHRGDAR